MMKKRVAHYYYLIFSLEASRLLPVHTEDYGLLNPVILRVVTDVRNHFIGEI